MSVYFREWILKSGKTGGEWYWRFMVDGQRSKERARNPDNPRQKARTKKEAEYFESIAYQRACQCEPIFSPKPKPCTFAQFVEEKYRPLAEANHCDFANGAGYCLSVLLPEFGSKLIDQISPFEIEAFKHRQKVREKLKAPGQTIKPNTVNRYLDTLSSIFSLAIGEKLRSDNPCDSVQRLAVEPITKCVLSFEEEDRLLAACENMRKVNRWDRDHVAHAIVVLVECGFRPKEFFTMKKSQVDLVGRKVTVISNKTGKSRRRSAQPKRRIVPISDRALPHYQALMATEGDKLYPYDSLKKVWINLCEEAGIPGFWLRWLRDTAKHRWELAGFGPFEIALMMGHSSPQMTMAYSILDPKRALALMARAGSAPAPALVGNPQARPPAPVATFPAAVTMVQCTAPNSAGSAPRSFTVTVSPAAPITGCPAYRLEHDDYYADLLED